MNADILDRYAPRLADAVKKQPDEPGIVDDLGAFGILRGVQDRALMLELRKKNGNAIAFSYAYLVKASFDPSQGIALHFGGSTVRLVGSNMGAEIAPNATLFRSILRHRVAWLQESTGNVFQRAKDAGLVIDDITVEP